MHIVIGNDHRGVEVKNRLLASLQGLGHQVDDLGTPSQQSVDYPDFALLVGTKVSQGQAERGILIRGTSIGMCIAANKVHGIRAASCQDLLSAEMSRRHNDANILCLSADLLGEELMDRMVRVWLETEFEGGRHSRRVEKIARIERDQNHPPG